MYIFSYLVNFVVFLLVFRNLFRVGILLYFSLGLRVLKILFIKIISEELSNCCMQDVYVDWFNNFIMVILFVIKYYVLKMCNMDVYELCRIRVFDKIVKLKIFRNFYLVDNVDEFIGSYQVIFYNIGCNNKFVIS